MNTLIAVLLVLQSPVDTTAAIRGTARSSFNGRPLSGVMISLPAVRKFTVTDSAGRFTLVRLPAGLQRIRVSYEGRGTEEFDYELERGKTKNLAVLLDVEAVDLAPIVVEVQHRDFARNLAGFYERRRSYAGFARFYTREDLEREGGTDLRWLLVLDGVFTQCSPRGCVPVRWSRGRVCPVAVAVDGMPFWEQDYGQIPLSDVQAVEIYRSGTGTPPSAAAVVTAGRHELYGSACGSVMIWTR